MTSSTWTSRAAALLLLLCAALSAQAPDSAAAAGKEAPKSPLAVERFELENGMRVLLLPLKRAPIVSCRLFYQTGSVHEHAGNTGIAHLLEHEMFKGTEKIASNELWELYESHGGTGLNAFTSSLMTAYFVTLPADRLELFFWLESDRMQNAVMREFDSERDVVREERRMRYDDSPTGRYFETLEATFWEGHPYRNPTIGWPSDIARLSKEQAEEHFRRFYKPSNAILVLVGDFDPARAKELTARYFAPIPPGERLPDLTFREPVQVGPKRFAQYKDDATPRVDILFHTPGIGDPDLFALDVAEGVLNGRTGRLYRDLVEGKRIATSASAGNAVQKWESSFELSASVRPGADAKAVEEALWDEIRRLQFEEIDPRELEKVKTQLIATNWRRLRDMEHLATQLAFFEMNGDWTLVTRFAEEVAKVTPAEVREAALRYLKVSNSTTGTILPASESPDAVWTIAPGAEKKAGEEAAREAETAEKREAGHE